MTDHRPVPGRLRAPSPGWTTRADVVVVGSGIAGLTAALRIHAADPSLHLLVVTDSPREAVDVILRSQAGPEDADVPLEDTPAEPRKHDAQ